MSTYSDQRTKTPLAIRWAQMSKQEQVIERKKQEIQLKLEAQKQAAALASAAKGNTPETKTEKKVNIFSNDGSFMKQFQALLDKQKKDSAPPEETKPKEEVKEKNEKDFVKKRDKSRDRKHDKRSYSPSNRKRDKNHGRDGEMKPRDEFRERTYQSQRFSSFEQDSEQFDRQNLKFSPPNQQFAPPNQQFAPPNQQFGPPNSQFGPLNNQFGPPNNQFGPQNSQFGPPNNQFGPPNNPFTPSNNPFPPPNQFGPPNNRFGPPNSQFGPPNNQFGPPSNPFRPPNNQFGPSNQQFGPPKEQFDPNTDKKEPDEMYEPESEQYDPETELYEEEEQNKQQPAAEEKKPAIPSLMEFPAIAPPKLPHNDSNDQSHPQWNNSGPMPPPFNMPPKFGPNVGSPNCGPVGPPNMGPPGFGPRAPMGMGPGPMPPGMRGPPSFMNCPNGPFPPFPPGPMGPNMPPMSPFFGPPRNMMGPPNIMPPFGRPPFRGMPPGPPGPPPPGFCPPPNMFMPPPPPQVPSDLEKDENDSKNDDKKPLLPLSKPKEEESNNWRQRRFSGVFSPGMKPEREEQSDWQDGNSDQLWLQSDNSRNFSSQMKNYPGDNKLEVDPDEKYEPEFSLQDDNSDDDSSQDRKPSFIQSQNHEWKREVNWNQSDWNQAQKHEASSQSDDDEDRKNERKRRKRKSRWGGEDDKNEVPPVAVMPQIPMPLMLQTMAPMPPNMPPMPPNMPHMPLCMPPTPPNMGNMGMPSNMGMPPMPPMPGMLAMKLAPLGGDGMMLTAVNRNNHALMQYAKTNYGSTNLSPDEWKKCEDNFKLNLLYQDMLKKREQVERLAAAGKHKHEYDSDEDTEAGTWEHKLRAREMNATEKWADELTKQAAGKHHIGDFLPPEELKKFMEKYSAMKGGKEPDLSDYKEFKLKEDNIGFKMLQKLGWNEGKGLGADGSGIVDPINKSNQPGGNAGLGVASADSVSADDDEFDAYRKRMMLAYRFRPNPLNNPRRPYY